MLRRATAPLPLGLLLLSAILLVAHSLAFNFVTDDAFISFVYARNLAEHGQLVFNLGERVEGYTNFLWTVILALGLRLHIPAEIASRVLGTAAGALTLLVCTLGARGLRDPADRLRPQDTLAALILAGVPGYACWSSGGLETQLFTLLVTIGALRYLREAYGTPGDTRVPSSLPFALAALTRPEGYLFFGLTGLWQLVHGLGKSGDAPARRFPLLPTRAEARWLLIFLVLCVPHIVFRRLYYGYFFPNTFYIKTSAASGAWQQGGYYLWAFVRETKLLALLLPALLGLMPIRGEAPAARQRYRRFLGYAGLLCGSFVAYVASVGGDFMGLHRFLMPAVPLFVIAGSVGLLRLLRAVRTPPLLALAACVVLLLCHGANAYLVDQRALSFIGADRGIDTPGYLRWYTADRAAIGKWFGQHVQPDDYQVVGGAGAQVYYAGIRALDSFGLSDEYVAHKVPPVSNRPGHQKFAPLDYVLSRRPTILTYNVYRIAAAPYQPAPEEAMTWRARGFHYVSVQIPGLSSPWYSFLKRIDRRLGPLPPADEP